MAHCILASFESQLRLALRTIIHCSPCRVARVDLSTNSELAPAEIQSETQCRAAKEDKLSIELRTMSRLSFENPEGRPLLYAQPRLCTVPQGVYARQTEFVVYRHRPHEFQIMQHLLSMYTATVSHFGPAPSSAAIEGRGLGDRELMNLAFLALFY